MNINAVGLWTVRALLVVGAAVAGCMGKDQASSGCIVALVISFLFLGEGK